MWNMPRVRPLRGLGHIDLTVKSKLSEPEEGGVVSEGAEEMVIHGKQWKKLICARIKQQSLSLLIVPFFGVIYLFI